MAFLILVVVSQLILHLISRRQMSGTSGASGASTYSGTGAPVDEFDRVIQDINDDIVNMQMSVHIDPSKRLDAFPPKST